MKYKRLISLILLFTIFLNCFSFNQTNVKANSGTIAVDVENRTKYTVAKLLILAGLTFTKVQDMNNAVNYVIDKSPDVYEGVKKSVSSATNSVIKVADSTWSNLKSLVQQDFKTGDNTYVQSSSATFNNTNYEIKNDVSFNSHYNYFEPNFYVYVNGLRDKRFGSPYCTYSPTGSGEGPSVYSEILGMYFDYSNGVLTACVEYAITFNKTGERKVNSKSCEIYNIDKSVVIRDGCSIPYTGQDVLGISDWDYKNDNYKDRVVVAPSATATGVLEYEGLLNKQYGDLTSEKSLDQDITKPGEGTGEDTGDITKPGEGTGESSGILQGLWDWLKGILQSILDAILSIPIVLQNILESIQNFFAPPTVSLDFKPLELNLSSKFPFCVPFDLINSIKAFRTDQQAPKFNIQFKDMNFNGHVTKGGGFVWDFGSFNKLVLILRYFILVVFVVNLTKITRDMIKG